MPLTPNGCDCFGCCTFPQLAGQGPGGADAFVWIGATDASNNGTCTFADILDTTKCPRCTPVPGCYNPCDKCELCIGKTTLPAECYAPRQRPKVEAGAANASTPACPRRCSAPAASSPAGSRARRLPDRLYCITGCCIKPKIE